jgi:hypothetical protein
MPVGFGLTTIMNPTNGIRETGLEFETHSGNVGGEIVGMCIQRSL